jgi:hypothetical protein
MQQDYTEFVKNPSRFFIQLKWESFKRHKIISIHSPFLKIYPEKIPNPDKYIA